jgi:hypothetical protein
MKTKLWVFDSASGSQGYVSVSDGTDISNAHIKGLRLATRRERVKWSLTRSRFSWIDFIAIASLAAILRDVFDSIT